MKEHIHKLPVYHAVLHRWISGFQRTGLSINYLSHLTEVPWEKLLEMMWSDPFISGTYCTVVGGPVFSNYPIGGGVVSSYTGTAATGDGRMTSYLRMARMILEKFPAPKYPSIRYMQGTLYVDRHHVSEHAEKELERSIKEWRNAQRQSAA